MKKCNFYSSATDGDTRQLHEEKRKTKHEATFFSENDDRIWKKN